MKKEYQEAIQSWQVALKQFQEKEDVESEAITLGNLGYAHLALNQDSQSLDYYKKSIEVSQKLRDGSIKTGLQADAYNSIGMIYSSAKNFDKAVEAFQQSMSIAERGEYRYGQANSLINIANVYNTSRKSESAIESLMKSLKVINEI
jgi:tetratricopeptide (TPR) repeat protein